jgi:hypothetical protein
MVASGSQRGVKSIMSNPIPILGYEPPATRRSVRIDRDELGTHISVPTPFAWPMLVGWALTLLLVGLVGFAFVPFIIIFWMVFPHGHLGSFLAIIVCIPAVVVIVNAALVYSTTTLIFLENDRLIVELPGLFTERRTFLIGPHLTVRAIDLGLGAILQIRNAEGYLNLCEGIPIDELKRIESALRQTIANRVTRQLPAFALL